MAEADRVRPVPTAALLPAPRPPSSLGLCDWALANGTRADGTQATSGPDLHKAPHAASGFSSPTPLAEFKTDRDMGVHQDGLAAKPLRT